jgi:hypothetical protein
MYVRKIGCEYRRLMKLAQDTASNDKVNRKVCRRKRS